MCTNFAHHLKPTLCSQLVLRPTFQVRRIGDPLVWRHRWCDEQNKVIHQYKYALSDEDTFYRDEWGPWIDKEVPRNDDVTGEVIMETVQRSDPLGVDLISSYPNIEEFPGLEEWLDLESWKAEQVFHHLKRWEFFSNGETAKASWAELHTWHTAHQSSNDIALGEPLSLPSGASFSTTPMPWSDMWSIILRDVDNESEESSIPFTQTSKDKRKGGGQPFLDPLSKRVDREALSTSRSAVELNRVTNPNYTEKQQRVAIAGDKKSGLAYVSDHINTEGSLFLIQLKHQEGEFAVGLGRRTFNKDVDVTEESKFEIEWFERKNKSKHCWGKQPAFRRAVHGYASNRKKIYSKSVESIDDFIQLAVKTTKATIGSDEPVLSQDTMDALRAKMSIAKEVKANRKGKAKKQLASSSSASMSSEEDDDDSDEHASSYSCSSDDQHESDVRRDQATKRRCK